MKDHEIRELVNQLRDVAIKYHGTGQLREQIARTVRAAILQAQSDDDGEPTDDERIMAIEGIHNCERCGDEGWVVGEMGITRCACGQAGNSPAQSDCCPEQNHVPPEQNCVAPAQSQGWIPVSEQMPPSRHEVLVGCWWGEKPRWCCKWATYIPGHPDAQGSGWLIPGGSWTPTHWMELPAGPKEVKSE
ncbi:DUF551 domain-containing protein [Klebsiella michiganensis]|uniref:DUF551 domain-containing protein n=1 Tax=Klebsiella michiganensis TaxID=1134687 RepID=UPI001E5A061E|nr:DUF551 domain-containing protein [Klebsiella michiganensis]